METIYNLDEVLQDLQENHEAEYCTHYGEPGYHDPEKGIIFANWNNIEKDIQEFLEEQGYELEWSDEWYIDYNNDKAWRTSPDGWDWQGQIAFMDGDVLTPDDDIGEWIEAFKDDPDRVLPSRIEQNELEELGWERVDEIYENGFHPGQNDNPKQIFDKLIARKDVQHVIFRLVRVQQFDIRFEVYTFPQEEEDQQASEEFRAWISKSINP